VKRKVGGWVLFGWGIYVCIIGVLTLALDHDLFGLLFLLIAGFSIWGGYKISHYRKGEYQRAYCPNCDTIFPGPSRDIANCPLCKQPLEVQSLNPWPMAGIGFGILGSGIATVMVDIVPIIWIGAFIWGGGMVIRSLYSWHKFRQHEKKLLRELSQY